MRTISFKADSDCTAEELLVSSGVSKRLLRRLKRTHGAITKNGSHIRTIDSVKAGESIVIILSDEKTLTPNPKLFAKVLYEDGDVVVYDKPPDMPVHPSLKHYDDSLGNLFAASYKDITFRPLNRLDRNTSGVCICAKNVFAASRVSQSITKVYYAAVCGKIEGKGVIDLPIARVNDSIIKRRVADCGQRAITEYEAVLNSLSGHYTLLKIILGTGRTHQIRVHLSHIGHPLAGDDMYGGELCDIKRQALHCGCASFVGTDGKRITVESELPQDIKSLMRI